jgi:hypothetical protein
VPIAVEVVRVKTGPETLLMVVVAAEFVVVVETVGNCT